MRAHALYFAMLGSLGCLLPGVAAADPYVIFNLNGTLPSGGTAMGTIAVNTTTGYLVTNNITVQEGGASHVFIGSFFESELTSGGMQYLYSVSYDPAGDALRLVFPEALLIGFTGGPLCSTTQACSGFSSYFFTGPFGQPQENFTTLAASAVTPEPGALGLVMTGVLGVGAMVRRRVRRL